MAYFRLWNDDKGQYREEFYYTHLNHKEQSVYEEILTAILNLERKAQLKVNISAKRLSDIYFSVLWDNPHICYVSPDSANIGTGALSCYIQFDYLFPPKQCRSMQNEFQDKVEQIVQNLDLEGLPDLEKELFVHDYMAANLSYDSDALGRGTSAYMAHSVYGAVMNKKAVCQGIAAMFKVLADLAGLKCIFVPGTLIGTATEGRHQPHAWNIICVEGCYAHLDVTNDLYAERQKRHYRYFNFSDSWAKKSYVWEMRGYPACESMQYYYYVYFHLSVDSVEELKTYIRRRKDKKFLEICFGEHFALPHENAAEYIGQLITQELARYFGSIQVEYEWIAEARIAYIQWT